MNAGALHENAPQIAQSMLDEIAAQSLVKNPTKLVAFVREAGMALQRSHFHQVILEVCRNCLAPFAKAGYETAKSMSNALEPHVRSARTEFINQRDKMLGFQAAVQQVARASNASDILDAIAKRLPHPDWTVQDRGRDLSAELGAGFDAFLAEVEEKVPQAIRDWSSKIESARGHFEFARDMIEPNKLPGIEGDLKELEVHFRQLDVAYKAYGRSVGWLRSAQEKGDSFLWTREGKICMDDLTNVGTKLALLDGKE